MVFTWIAAVDVQSYCVGNTEASAGGQIYNIYIYSRYISCVAVAAFQTPSRRVSMKHFEEYRMRNVLETEKIHYKVCLLTWDDLCLLWITVKTKNVWWNKHSAHRTDQLFPVFIIIVAFLHRLRTATRPMLADTREELQLVRWNVTPERWHLPSPGSLHKETASSRTKLRKSDYLTSPDFHDLENDL